MQKQDARLKAAFDVVVALAVFAKRTFHAAGHDFALVRGELVDQGKAFGPGLRSGAARAIIHLVVQLYEMPQIVFKAESAGERAVGRAAPENLLVAD